MLAFYKHFNVKKELWLNNNIVIIAGGQLVDILNSRGCPLPCNDVLQVFFQTCRAVQHMHRQNPPIIHRDLKVGITPI